MTNLIVLGISCASEQPIWYFLPQTVTFHQRTDFILSSCSFWAHWSSTPASCSHSRILFAIQCHWTRSPVSPTHSWKSRFLFQYENSGPGEHCCLWASGAVWMDWLVADSNAFGRKKRISNIWLLILFPWRPVLLAFHACSSFLGVVQIVWACLNEPGPGY